MHQTRRGEDAAGEVGAVDVEGEQVGEGEHVVGGQGVADRAQRVDGVEDWDRIETRTAPPTAPSGASVTTESSEATPATQSRWIAR